MGRRGARDVPPARAARSRHAAIDDDAMLLGRELERQAAGMRFVAQRERRRRPGISQHQGRAALQALVA